VRGQQIGRGSGPSSHDERSVLRLDARQEGTERAVRLQPPVRRSTLGGAQAEELLKQHESKTLEFKSTLRWNLKEKRKDTAVTYAAIKTIAAFLNTEGGDLLIGAGDDRSVVGIEADDFDNEDKFMLHLSQMVRNTLGDRASTCIDPRMQIVKGKTVCVVTCQRSPEPVLMKTKDAVESKGEFYVRSGPGTVRLSPKDSEQYIKTRFSKLSETKNTPIV